MVPAATKGSPAASKAARGLGYAGVYARELVGVHQGGEFLCRQGAIGIGLGYDHAREGRNQNVDNTGHVLVGQRGTQQRGAILHARIDLVQRTHKVLAALRVMAGVDQLERTSPQHIKSTRRGAAHKRRIELVMIELVTQIPSHSIIAHAAFCG